MTRRRDPGRDWAAIAAVVLGFLLVLTVISYVWMPLLPWQEERDAGQDTIEQTYDADSAISDYEWFRTQYHDIDAQRAQIENAYAEEEQFHETYGDDPDDWSREAETRHGRIHERITGYQNQLEDMVAEYNARSEMANRELFKCHLPFKVDERFAIRGPPGSGDADQPQDVGPDGDPIDGDPPPAEECDGLPDQIDS